MRKLDSPKNRGDTGVSMSGAFKLDHLQSVEQIVFQKLSTSLTFILRACSNFISLSWGEGIINSGSGVTGRGRPAPERLGEEENGS